MPDVSVMAWNEISPQAGSMYVGGDFVGDDFTKLYVISYTLQDLRLIDTQSGLVTIIGAMELFNGGGWTGMTWGGRMYLSSVDGNDSYLYNVNLETGKTSVIGRICAHCTVIDIAATSDGRMYGFDIHTDVLIRIDPVTARSAVIGPVGFDGNYSQDMDYDEATRRLYLAAFNRITYQGELRLADVNSGATTLIGVFPNGDEIDAFAFASVRAVTTNTYLPVVMKAEEK